VLEFLPQSLARSSHFLFITVVPAMFSLVEYSAIIWSTEPTDTYVLSARPTVPTGASINLAKLHQKGHFLMHFLSVFSFKKIQDVVHEPFESSLSRANLILSPRKYITDLLLTCSKIIILATLHGCIA
jgi:hypothetical protein